MAKYSINLLQPELIVKPALLTLEKVAGLWVIVLVAVLIWGFVSANQVEHYKTSINQLNNQKAEQEQQLADLEQKVKDRKPDARLVEEVKTLNLLLSHKQALQGYLTDSSQLSVAGFVEAMTELSNNHHRDVSLDRVIIRDNEMLFAGLAKNPNAVPVWLAGFEQSKLLAGRRFSQLSLNENEQGYISFSVSSSRQLTNNSKEQ